MSAHKDWHHLTHSLSVAMNAVRRGQPAVAKGFSALASAATAPGALNRKTKELLALAIAIAMMFLGGFPQTAVINCWFIFAYALVSVS